MSPKHAAVPLALVTILSAALATGARAADEPKTYACAFKTGESQVYSNGHYRSRSAKPIAFEITSIDLAGQRAELLSPGGGRGALRIVRAVGANHFLEVVTEGYLNITTIYALDERRGTYPAVHSRHFGVLGEPVVAQYTGACTAK